MGTIDENKAVVRQYIEEAINQGNLAAADELLAPDFVMEHAGVPGPIHGVEGFRQLIRGLKCGFPDFHGTMADLVAEGDRVAVRFVWRGTHRGPFNEIAATDKPIIVGGCAIYRLAGGRIAEVHAEFDTLALLQQLGAS